LACVYLILLPLFEQFDAKEKMRGFCEDLKKPFQARYNPYSQTVTIDRAVQREEN
jgi:hypothetical protein